MNEEQIKAELVALAKGIGEKLQGIEDGRQADNKEYKSVWEDLKKVADEQRTLAEKTAARMDELEKLGTKAQAYAATFGQRLFKAVEEEKDKLAAFEKSGEPFMVRKVVGDLNIGNLTGPIAEQERDPIVRGSNYRLAHMRNIVPVTGTSAPITEVVRHTGGEGGPAEQVANGDLKAQTDQDFALVTFNNFTIAHWERMPTQWLADYAAIVAYIQTNMIEQLLNLEDARLLTGTGVNQVLGLITAGTLFAPGVSGIPQANRFDVLRLAIAQLATTGINGGGYNADFIIVNPMDFATMQLTKDAQGLYTLPAFLSQNGQEISGVRVIGHNAIALGNFLVGEARQAALQIYAPLTLSFSRDDRDNFIRNLITVKVEERIKFPIYRPDAFVRGVFTTAIGVID